MKTCNVLVNKIFGRLDNTRNLSGIITDSFIVTSGSPEAPITPPEQTPVESTPLTAEDETNTNQLKEYACDPNSQYPVLCDIDGEKICVGEDQKGWCNDAAKRSLVNINKFKFENEGRNWSIPATKSLVSQTGGKRTYKKSGNRRPRQCKLT
jgi:hypothetical protein